MELGGKTLYHGTVVLRINKSLTFPDTFLTREAAQDKMLEIADTRNQLEQEALGW